MNGEYRRPIEKVGNDVLKAGSSVSNSAHEAARDVTKVIDRLNKSIVDSAAIQSVGILTTMEIEELRILINYGETATAYAKDRLKNQAIRGMYHQLSDLGFIYCKSFGDTTLFLGIDPKASWAINRFDMITKEEERKKREEKRQRKSDRRFSVLCLIGGWIGGILSVLAIDWIRTIITSG